MQLGVCTWIFGDIELERLLPAVAQCGVDGIELISIVDRSNLGLLLDTYHMNIEETDLIESIRAAAAHLMLLRVANSSRRAPGRGHVPFPQLIEAVHAIGYSGPWIIECTVPSPNPFAVNPASYQQTLEEVSTSISYLRALEEGGENRSANGCITTN